uniref:Piwi domain-containing protein n=1 Tax=Parastrongyloides trichosuri TaxID=131310 RepID=A0A0N4ZRK3_PARTI
MSSKKKSKVSVKEDLQKSSTKNKSGDTGKISQEKEFESKQAQEKISNPKKSEKKSGGVDSAGSQEKDKPQSSGKIFEKKSGGVDSASSQEKDKPQSSGKIFEKKSGGVDSASSQEKDKPQSSGKKSEKKSGGVYNVSTQEKDKPQSSGKIFEKKSGGVYNVSTQEKGKPQSSGKIFEKKSGGVDSASSQEKDKPRSSGKIFEKKSRGVHNVSTQEKDKPQSSGKIFEKKAYDSSEKSFQGKKLQSKDTDQILTTTNLLKNIKFEKSPVDYKVKNPNSLATVEVSNYKNYRLRKSTDKLTIGTDLNVITNVYKFKLPANLFVDLFRVDFLDHKKKVMDKFKKSSMRRLLMEVLLKMENSNMYNYIYDDANLLYVANSCFKETKYEICANPGSKTPFYVRLEKSKQLEIKLSDTDNTTHIESKTFLNLLLTQFCRTPTLDHYQKKLVGIQNKIFFKPSEDKSDVCSLDFLRQIWTGLCFSMSLGPRGLPIININQNYSIFPKSELTAIDFYIEANGARGKSIKLESLSMDNRGRRKMTDLLKGLNLMVTYNLSKEFTVFEVTNKLPDKTFIEKDGKKQSITEYFKQHYGIELKNKFLPLIQMNPKQSNILIPMELIKISTNSQRLREKVKGNLTRKMLEYCTREPRAKFNEINDALSSSYNFSSEFYKNYNVGIEEQIGTIAKVLPKINIKQPADKQERAVYDKKIDNFSYGIIFVNSRTSFDRQKIMTNKVQHIIKSVSNYGANFSQNLNAKYVISCNSKNMESDIREKLKSYSDGMKMNHLIIFVINEDDDCYGKIKMICELKEFVGCHSQVLKTKTIERIAPNNPKDRITENISMKVNGKLGGLSKSLSYTLNNLSFFKKKFFDPENSTIYIGADVIHPAPQDIDKVPSISAVVGSMDILGFSYAASGKIHTSTINQGKKAMETLQYFKDQIKERLQKFNESTNTVPRHIVVFRDGVADSQFKMTMDFEVKSINEACSEISERYKPTITFLVVQKRHGVRFFDPKNTKNGNVPENTIIENDIVNPEMLDFYAVLHKGLRGTSRPCHIYALYDDWNLSMDEISLLSCWMANICTRCEAPIGIPTPCYYADLACTRLKYHYIETGRDKGEISFEFHANIKDKQFFV